jgi:hypothetical protein
VRTSRAWSGRDSLGASTAAPPGGRPLAPSTDDADVTVACGPVAIGITGGLRDFGFASHDRSIHRHSCLRSESVSWSSGDVVFGTHRALRRIVRRWRRRGA